MYRSSPKTPSVVDGQPSPTVVTECWVEGCCFEQSLLSIDKHLVFRPLPVPMPINGTTPFQIHLSGLSTEDLTYLRRLIRVIGATQAVSLNRQTTHLVSGRSDGPKVDKAREWGVKVVSKAWLLAMGGSGQVESEEDYPVDSSSTTTVTDGGEKADSLKPPPASVSQSQSQARALKLTPTHVDDHGRPSITGSMSASNTSSLRGANPGLAGAANPLSPPQGPSARKLNQATDDSRSTSRASASDEDVPMKSAYPAESIGTSGRNREMTDVLRQLAEKGDTSATRIKAVSVSHSAMIHRLTGSHAAPKEHSEAEPPQR
jgi:DNA replication regulator DPB11